MRTYKCDRCDQYYDGLLQSDWQDVYDSHGINHFMTTVSDRNWSADLCPNCLNDLGKWYKKGRNKEVSE